MPALCVCAPFVIQVSSDTPPAQYVVPVHASFAALALVVVGYRTSVERQAHASSVTRLGQSRYLPCKVVLATVLVDCQ